MPMAVEQTQHNITIDDSAPSSQTQDPQPPANESSQRQDPQPPANGSSQPEQTESYELMRDLSKYILLLATLVGTVTYAAGFNPTGGVWQETVAASGQLAGDSILQTTSHRRYLVFFYSNAVAFASSLLIIVLMLFLTILKKQLQLMPLQAVMVVDLLSIMGAYAAATCRDKTTTIYSSVLVVLVIAYLTYQKVLASWLGSHGSTTMKPVDEKRFRKVLMLLATFAVSVTYVAGMSTPGGFWDNTENGHRPGDAILKDSHRKRLTVFLCFNGLAFVASLLIIVVLLDKKLRLTEAYLFIGAALISLIVSYTAGSCRDTDTNFYVGSLAIAVLAFMALLRVKGIKDTIEHASTWFWTKIKSFRCTECGRLPNAGATGAPDPESSRYAAEQARSLVLLLATLAATITYQAGLDPPGGVWTDNINGHMAGDPILLTMNAGRYKAFYYCNSVAFVASLVAIILVQYKLMIKTHVLEAAMVLDLFGLIGAYAAGSARDLTTSIYAMALAGAVLVYVVIHVVFFTLNHTPPKPDDIKFVEKRRKQLLLFAVLVATITYQAGLTPPGGFRLRDDESGGYQAGDPVLLYNFHRRYTAFFYCNTVSFMLSIALIILLVNRNLYIPAIRSHALAVCTAAGMFGLMGAYAAGSTQHLKTSIFIFVLGAVVFFIIVVLLLVFSKEEEQAGLDPPGGAWQHNSSWYDAGNPIMHDNRRPRYLAFFYSNSSSFVASIVVIILLLPRRLHENESLLKVMNATIVLDLLTLLVAYAAGSNRGWKTSVYVVALIIAV